VSDRKIGSGTNEKYYELVEALGGARLVAKFSRAGRPEEQVINTGPAYAALLLSAEQGRCSGLEFFAR